MFGEQLQNTNAPLIIQQIGLGWPISLDQL